MKTINVLLLGFLCVHILSCEPENRYYKQPNVKLKASLSHTSEAIRLGDTLVVEVQLPDTLKGTNYLGETKTVVVNSLQEAWFGLEYYRLDTTKNKVWLDSTEVTTWYVPSQKPPCYNCFMLVPHLQTATHPFNTKIYIVPRVKGLYYLQLTPQAGNCTANNSVNLGLVVGFDVPDDHLYLVAPYLGGQQFYDAISQARTDGFGYFAFRVE